VIATAVVRDMTEGRRMAQVMSMAMTVFMIVPIIAPGIGQLILFVAPWRWIFGALLIYSLLVLAWALWRLPETLKPEHRKAFNPPAIAAGYAAVLRERQTIGYMAASIFVTACLFGYITSSEQLFVDVYDLGAAFPIVFGSIAIAISAGTFLNSRLVMRYGMRRLSHITMILFTASAAVLAVLAANDLANFWVFTGVLAVTFAMFGLISSNFNALAMEPVGQVAGSGSALFGAVTASGGAVLGGLIARAFDGTVAPFALGLALSGLATIVAVALTERFKLFGRTA
jgi:DHA1 family bicyclomycin/chloramphenicol resistance-like MFS transporter